MKKQATDPQADLGKPPPSSKLLQENPDLVDRIMEYIWAAPEMAAAVEKYKLSELKAKIRAEFAGEQAYVRKTEAHAASILALFNGRNATEVARRLNVHRSTVYRHIKQPRK